LMQDGISIPYKTVYHTVKMLLNPATEAVIRKRNFLSVRPYDFAHHIVAKVLITPMSAVKVYLFSKIS
ncbi:hypothetical protein, partial [Paenibacillus elgii]|uniref:hypothetical protein n=1 Tax=Paenibacillus elgii TaxID=189691 RepID=UPI003B4349CE